MDYQAEARLAVVQHERQNQPSRGTILRSDGGPRRKALTQRETLDYHLLRLAFRAAWTGPVTQAPPVAIPARPRVPQRHIGTPYGI